MRRTLLAVTLAATFLAIFVLIAPSLALAQASGLKPGFRDMKWDMPPQPGMTKDHVEDSLTYYKRTTDKLSIGNAELASIQYGFFNNRFYGIAITTEARHADTLLAVLQESWGKGYQSNPYIKSWIWSNGDTLAGYRTNEIRHIGSLSIFSKETLKEVQAADAAIAAKGKKDL